MQHTGPPGQDWYVYTEVATAVLLSGPQLAAIAERLRQQPGVPAAQATASSLGRRYSVAARMRLHATDAQTAQQQAANMLTSLLAEMDVNPGRVIAEGLISDS